MVEEREFLEAILRRPDDDAMKLVYADWLEEHCDPRAEYLRLMVKTRQDRVVTSELRTRHHDSSTALAQVRAKQLEFWKNNINAGGAFGVDTGLAQRIKDLEQELADLSGEMRQSIPGRLQELAAGFDVIWLALVSDPEIEGCGKSTGDDWRLRFDFVCDRTWADLQPTDDTTVRHCAACNKNVHYCDNLADAREHSAENHCIAVDIGVIRRDGDLIPATQFLGRPSKEDLRQTYEENVDAVSRARLDHQGKQSTRKIHKTDAVLAAAPVPQSKKKITQIAQ
jgi:uncharacterized protein (TIGR02996 family)